jgi:hypothetical protein
MKRLVVIAALLAASALSGCETATPYQPLHAPGSRASGGYYDHQIEANRFEVGFRGNALTSRETVERYLLYRSAELTLAQGFDWFEDVDRHTGRKSEVFVEPGPYGYWGPRWGYRRFGPWGPYYGDVERVDRYTASAQILLGHGPKPNDRQAFDARSVVEHLRPALMAPRT